MRRLSPRGVLPVLLGLYLVMLLASGAFAPAIVGPDDNGYFAQGTRLATNGHAWLAPESPVEYVGMHWLLAPDGRYFSRYSPGLAVLLAGAYAVGGPVLCVALYPLLAVATLLGFHLLLRPLIGEWWAIAGVVFLGATSTFIGHTFVCDAHLPVTAFFVWGLHFLLRWRREGRLVDALLAGFLLGVVPTIRPPEVLLGLGAAVLLLTGRRDTADAWRGRIAAIGAAALPVLALAIYNQLSFGAFWRTAYSLSAEQTAFAFDSLREHAFLYLQNLLSDGPGVLMPFAILGVLFMLVARPTRAAGVACALFVAPTLLLYMAYYWAPQQNAAMTLRFLLPVFPVIIAAALWGLRELLRARPAPVQLAAIALFLVVQASIGIAVGGREAGRTASTKQSLAFATKVMHEYVEPGAVVMGAPTLLQHLDFVREWKVADTTLLGGAGGRMPGAVRARAAGGMPSAVGGDSGQPSPMQQRKRAAREVAFGGAIGARREEIFAGELLRWSGDRGVYYVGTQAQLRQFSGSWVNAADFEIVVEVDFPVVEAEAIESAARLGPMGGLPPPDMLPQGPPGGGFPGAGPGMPGMRQGPGPGGRGGGGPGGMMRDPFGGAETMIVARWNPPETLRARLATN